ncbi:MAG: hypothetical protein ACK2TZ_08760 [Anaerolineales bacterium]
MIKRWIALGLCVVFILSACSPQAGPNTDSVQSEEQGPGESIEVSAPENEDDSQPAENTEDTPQDTPLPPTETAQVEVVHWEFPGPFAQTPLQHVYDCVMGRRISTGNEIALNPVCDQWERNYFERPVNDALVEFYPQLDIVESQFGQDENWYYTRIQLYAEDTDSLLLDGVYALEIDVDLDARGDFLIIAASPGNYPPDEWHSDGVQVWFDTNDDVGGPQAVLVDPRYDGDGYETPLYDSRAGTRSVLKTPRLAAV